MFNLELKKEINVLREQLEEERHTHSLELSKLKLDTKTKETELQGQVEVLKHTLETKEKLLKTFRNSDVEKLNVEVEDLKKQLKEASAQSREVDLQKALNEIEVLRAELSLKDKLVKELSNLPDVKRMIDNVANLRVPAIDEMKEIFTLFDGSKATKTMNEINKLSNMVKELILNSNGYGGYNNPRFR